ncbi:hypothetical protein NBRC10512v2_003278 [Rhodotorula toruloides]|uniref:Proteophosphoglycan ppg4 n=1 Tax=Rhodotorula toruloides (strain NP11) TaxID=1130832 RepID=M7WVP4_RHOT1|nr:uncharacterized protein RHTO_00910 [Rhodotorula toruloides NP11]EMS22156.1 hypothetical protein RHTO_00910 [Rhodotorula toruloides NP11]
MTTWLTVLVAWLAALASGWERVLQADRAIDRWTAEITKTKSAIFVAGLVFVFYAIAVYVVLSWTTIGRRVSYRLVSSSLPFEGLCRAQVLYASKVEPLRTLWEGFTDLSQLDLRLIAEFLDIALLVNEVDVQHRIKTGAAPGDDQRDLRRRVETYTSLMGLILRRIIVFVVLLVGGSTRILSWGHVAELAVVCCAWWAINDSTRHSLLHNENGLAFLDRVRSLAMSMFRLLEFDDLVIADFEYFQATKHLDEPDAHLCEAILAAVKGRRDLTDKLRDERAKNRTRAGSLRRSD